jgi:phospholipase/lecithinase/hemolysin
MGVSVIDTVPVFLANPDPRSLYVMGRNNHPTAAGHRLLAEFIKSRLGAIAEAKGIARSGGRS